MGPRLRALPHPHRGRQDELIRRGCSAGCFCISCPGLQQSPGGRRQAGNSSSTKHPPQQGGIVRGLNFNPVMRKKRNTRKRFPPSCWLASSLRLSGRLWSDGSRRECVFPAAWEGMADVGNHCYAFLQLGELLYATIRASLRLLDRKPGSCVLRQTAIVMARKLCRGAAVFSRLLGSVCTSQPRR